MVCIDGLSGGASITYIIVQSLALSSMTWALPTSACPTADDRGLNLPVFLLPAALVEYQGQELNYLGEVCVGRAISTDK